VQDGRVEAGRAAAALARAAGGGAGAALADALWLAGLEARSTKSEEERELSAPWKRLCESARQCVAVGACSKVELQERLELELLQGAGLGCSSAWGQSGRPKCAQLAGWRRNVVALLPKQHEVPQSGPVYLASTRPTYRLLDRPHPVMPVQRPYNGQASFARPRAVPPRKDYEI
jgi:hypothetical protein